MSTNVNFTTALLNAFASATDTRTLNKGELILREGEVEHNLYFIETGAVRLFYLSEFDDHTIRLGYQGTFINSLSSYIAEKPSEFYLEAIRKTTLKVLQKKDIVKLAMNSLESMAGYTALLETVVSQQIDREIDLLITSPTERLRRVLGRSPDLFQQVPLKYIASYLRMKPETLSRIRNS